MPDQQFGLFAVREEDGLLQWRGFFTDLESVKSYAQELAEREGLRTSVLSLAGFNEVASYLPSRRTRGGRPDR